MGTGWRYAHFQLQPNYERATAYDEDGKKIKEWSGTSSYHYDNFIDAVRAESRADLNAEILEGHLSSALCHTGNVAYQLGRRLPASEILQELSGQDVLVDSVDRMIHHLRANEVDVDKPVLALGPQLEMDPSTERFTNNDAANDLLRRDNDRPFKVPAVPIEDS